ncbi:rod shape-determining protein MreD [Thalassoroseus pseudoceratinae]|uniref:rod shape-determining protein MreD n=1 Tax=Thalassoroseus pseudoceratinae TaxID=2713176 RepID=UPI0014215D46|nr:rod shape-determining protein MreD [Thalassoroseus pseudoceratinae]
MQHLGFLLLIYTALVCQVTGVLTGPVGPHYLVLAVVTAGLTLRGWSAYVWAAIAGLLSDGLIGGPLGVDMLVGVWTVFGIRRWLASHSQRGESAGMTATVSVAAVAIFAALFFSQTARLLITGQQSDHAQVVLAVAATGFCTLAVVLIFLCVQAFVRRLAVQPLPHEINL